MSPLEKAIWRAVATPFQLRDFGHDYVDDDGEVGFEMNSEQMDDFNAASIAAKDAILKVLNDPALMPQAQSQIEERASATPSAPRSDKPT
jgi:hypothetical protein